MIALNRRRVMGGEDKYMLLHHWEASDWEGVGTTWNDRVGGISLSVRNGIPTFQDGYLAISNSQSFIHNNMNSWLFLGDDFKIVVEGLCSANLTDNSFFVDFGSVTTAYHAFCFAISADGTVFHNAKIKGNGSANTYDVPTNDRLFLPANTPFEYTFGMCRVDEDYNVLFSQYQNEIRYGATMLTRAEATFDRTNMWHSSSFVVGTGVLAVGDSQNKYIKSIKIYRLKE